MTITEMLALRKKCLDQSIWVHASNIHWLLEAVAAQEEEIAGMRIELNRLRKPPRIRKRVKP